MAESAEDCFCKGSAPLKKTCLLMLKLLRSMNMDFKNETFREIAKDMNTDVESLLQVSPLGHCVICLSKKLARQLGCPHATDEQGQLRRDRKKRKRERTEDMSTAGRQTKKARIISTDEAVQVADSATGVNNTAAPAALLNIKEEDEDDDNDGSDGSDGSAAARRYGSALLDELEASLGWETTSMDEDDLP
ncbi:hypothetical protein AYL99_08519 [Fonsecaea erecta]|uniref:Uncharacterized protein n=1 Tax=Fonsecaea erecta TaxID=1367422 RepID=A0A178ZE90_9EURO|nr:hypothetical protein AYL99_08519 [Fonsecaea erecta]OAP57781.1 hypothetical protein AYL99_08519 [Fonsecaea erecta]